MTNAASVILSVALMLLAGFSCAKLLELICLPHVTAYILAGILLGPYVLHIIPESIVSGTDFLPDIALAFIAFSVSEYFSLSVLKKNGMKVVLITLFESLTASLVIFLAASLLLGLDTAFCVILSALAAATAPASTIMTIRQTKAKGELVDTLLQVVALDDAVGLVAYSVAITIAVWAIAGSSNISGKELILLPVARNIGALVLGLAAGFLLKVFVPRENTSESRLIIAVCTIFLFCGVCSRLEVSPLLGCMLIGTIYINTTGDHRLFSQLNHFSAPLLLIFFVRSGMSFDLGALFATDQAVGGVSLMEIGVVYFFLRILGKYAGSWIGCLLTGSSAPVRRYLGLALVPQAGVAIGLAAMCARILGGREGSQLQTIILLSSVLYELIGPSCGKLALYLSHSYEIPCSRADKA